MRIDVFDQTIELAINRSIVLHDARNAEIVCTRGRIWITEDPLRNDVALEEGSSHVVRVDGLAFITALSPSSVWLREPPWVGARAPVRGSLKALASAARGLLVRWRASGVGGRAAA